MSAGVPVREGLPHCGWVLVRGPHFQEAEGQDRHLHEISWRVLRLAFRRFLTQVICLVATGFVTCVRFVPIVLSLTHVFAPCVAHALFVTDVRELRNIDLMQCDEETRGTLLARLT